MKKTLAFIAILSILSLQSCASQGGANSNQTLNLDVSGTWTLIHIDESSGTTLEEAFPNKKPTLTLEAISKKLTGNTGCNQMFGSFSTQQNKVNFSGIGTTRMYCEEVKEDVYLQLFNAVDSYTLMDNELSFKNADGKTILKYSK